MHGKKVSGTELVGVLFLIILVFAAIPIIVFLSAFLGVKVVLLILAAKYWAAFWWSCLYSLLYVPAGIAKFKE